MLIKPWSHGAAGKLGALKKKKKKKKSSDSIRSRTRNFPACSIAPQASMQQLIL
jgi:hypothetical protein